MTPEHDFFQQDQQQWFEEFVDAELSEMLTDTNPHPQKFEFDDIPF
jgi:hypothetical protein